MATPGGLAEDLVGALPAGHRGPVLDPACGDGALLVAAARRFGVERVRGIELAGDLCRRARARLVEAGSAPEQAERQVVCADALGGVEWAAGSAVVANPPWLSFSGRQAGRRREGEAGPAGGWPSLQGAFLVAIARHVAAQRSSAAVLLPSAMAEQDGYAPVRAEVARRTRLVGAPRDLGERAFPGVLEPAMRIVLAARGGRGAEADGAAWRFPSAPEQAFLDELADRPRVAPEAFADPGVHTGNAARQLVFDEPGAGRRPLRQGRDLAAYRLGAASAHLDVRVEAAGERRFRRAAPEHYASFPVLLRQTADRPVAALHEPRGYFRNSLLASRGSAGLDDAFLVAVLNCPVAAAWHRTMFRDARQRTFPQVKVGHLRQLPLPIRVRDEARRVHDAVAREVRALAAGAGEVPAERRRAVEDRVVELYGLSASALERVRAESPR